jgi:hypothetical protein
VQRPDRSAFCSAVAPRRHAPTRHTPARSCQPRRPSGRRVLPAPRVRGNASALGRLPHRPPRGAEQDHARPAQRAPAVGLATLPQTAPPQCQPTARRSHSSMRRPPRARSGGADHRTGSPEHRRPLLSATPLRKTTPGYECSRCVCCVRVACSARRRACRSPGVAVVAGARRRTSVVPEVRVRRTRPARRDRGPGNHGPRRATPPSWVTRYRSITVSVTGRRHRNCGRLDRHVSVLLREARTATRWRSPRSWSRSRHLFRSKGGKRRVRHR